MTGHRFLVALTGRLNIPIRLITVMLMVMSALAAPWGTVNAGIEEDLQYVVDNTTLIGSLNELAATFPASIPAVIVDADYKINSRMTLAGDALPAGSTVTIWLTVNEGTPFPYATAVPIPASPFWVTNLFPGAAAADFNANYGGRVEVYSITINSAGGNPLDINASVLIESVISEDEFATETVLAAITLPVNIPADESAALAWVQANTELSSVSGTIADLTATFPASIPAVIVAEDYLIDSRMTLADPLPEGTTATVSRGGVEVLSDITLNGTGPFWFTELFDPDAPRADFDAGYGGAVEEYVITLSGVVPFDFATTVYIESVISKDAYETETVLDDITLDAEILLTETDALAYLVDNTKLTSVSGTIADLKATFPASIPALIVAEEYKIDSRMTLAEGLPVGTTVTVARDGVTILPKITVSGTGPFWFTELFDPDAPRANFDAGYGGAVEDYVITLNGSVPFDFATTVYIESVISKDDYVTETVLDDITLNAAIPANEVEALDWLQENTTLTGSFSSLTAAFPASIPPVIVDAPYTINSRMTLGEALPAGSTVTITLSVNGGDPVPYAQDVPIPASPFWITDLFPGANASEFDGNYGGRVEQYSITINSGGGNADPFDTTVLIESVIEKAGVETVLAYITLPINVAADEAAAIALVQAEMSITGTLEGLVAEFPQSIPDVLTSTGYYIDSQINLSAPLPAGSKVTILRDDVTIVNGATLTGSGPFWITDLVGVDPSPFGEGYEGAVENYQITVTGNTAPINITVAVTSTISRDFDAAEPVLVVLAEKNDLMLIQDIPDLDDALVWLQANTTLIGSLNELAATFPASIPAVIVDADYKINSRMTLAGDALPAGSTVTIWLTVNEGTPFPYATAVPIPASPFWVTNLFPGAAAADFNANYGGRVEVYSITINSAGGNPLDINASVLIESVISEDEFATETVLAAITLPVNIPADESAALAWVQANTELSSVSGTIADLTATFPASIPAVIVAEDYLIDSRMTLADPLPEGTTATVSRGGVEVLSDITLNGTGPFWFTELFDPDAPRADFDAGYGGAVEEYVITLSGVVPFDFATTVYIESVISKDAYETETVLDDITLDAEILLTETDALAYLVDNTKLTSVSGTIADLKATFPVGIPAVIVAEPYQINSRITLTHALPTGSKITIIRDGVEEVSDQELAGTEYWYTDLVGYPLIAAADFDGGYGGAVENYVITLTGPGGEPLAFQTSVKIESIISMDGFETNIVLADIRVDTAPPSVDVPDMGVYPDPDYQSIYGHFWQPNTPVTLIIGQYSNQTMSDYKGDVTFNNFGFPLVHGLVLEMTDGYTERTHTIIDLTITDLDQTLDHVSGTANPGEVVTYACYRKICKWIYPQTDFNRQWSADYHDWVNIAPGAEGSVWQYDVEGNFTRIIWGIPISINLISPALEEHLVTSKVSFSWEDNPDVDLYNLQLSLDSAFTALLLNTTTTASEYSHDTPLMNGQRYYWRVRPYYKTSWLGWSQTGMFFSMNPPLAPVPVSPANSAISFSETPVLTWNPVQNIDHFQLQISDTNSFTGTLMDATLASGSTEYIPDPPLSNGQFYWRVRAFDSQGVGSPWSVYRWFTVNTSEPTLGNPAADAVVPGTPTYTWLVKTGAKNYQIEYTYYLDEVGEAIPPFDVLTTSYKPAPQVPGRYEWRVRAKDAMDEWSDWSEVRSVTILLPIPSKAVLSSPATGSYVFVNHPTLEWREVSYAERYQLQISKSYTFSPTELDDFISAGTEYQPSLAEGKYYWRVRAINKVGEDPEQVGTWSSYRSFKVNTTAPVLIRPAINGAVFGTPTYTWAAVSGAKSYEFQYTQEGFDPPGFTSGKLTTTSYTPGEAQPLGGYSWRVGAKDAQDNWKWSDTRSLTIELPVPAKTVLKSPANKTYVFTTTPILSLNKVAYAEEYEIQISKTYTFTATEIDKVFTGTEYQPTDNELLADGKYYWRVRALNQVGGDPVLTQKGAWSSYRYFTVNHNGPVLSSPPDSSISMGTPIYTWLAKAGAKAYRFEYDDNDEFNSPGQSAAEMTSTSYTPPTQEADITYYWRVSAKDALGEWSEWSEARSLTVLLPIPSKAVLDFPSNGGYLSTTTPTLTWKAVPYAEKYQLQISNTSTFFTTVLDRADIGKLTFSSIDYAPALENGKYYWRVRAINVIEPDTEQTGAWSSYRYFTVDTIIPAVPALLKPTANGFTYDTTPSLTVKAASGAKYYRYQVAEASDFNNILVDSGEGVKVGTTYTVPSSMALPYREAYYWRVKSIDAAFNESEWSAPRSFTVTFQNAPAYGAFTTDTTPTFTWYAVSGALGYQLEIKDDPAYEENLDYPNYVITIGKVTRYTVSNLTPLPKGRYLWQMRVRTASGWRESPWRPLTIYSTPLPAAPTLVGPVSGAILAAPVLTWEHTTSDARSFEIWVDNSVLFTSREYQGVFEVSQTEATVPALPDGRYYWKMRAYNEFGVPGPWSVYRYFMVVSSP